MASPASVMALGSTRVSPSGVFDCSPSVVALRRIKVVSRVSCRDHAWVKRWSNPAAGFVCRCMITTDVVEEKANSLSPEAFRNSSTGVTSSSSSGGGNLGGSDFVLKPPPKPVLNMKPVVGAKSAGLAQSSGAPMQDAREKVMDSLGEVLEKAEKLETSRRDRFSNQVNNANGATASGGVRPVRGPVNSAASGTPASGSRMPKAERDVWRKGNPVGKVPEVGKQAPKVPKEEEKGNSPSSAGAKKLEAPPSPASLMPSPPDKFVPRLQSRPSVAPLNPPSPPMVKGPTEKKHPILIDRHASKKVRDAERLIEERASAPTRKPAPYKPRVGIQKGSGPTGSFRGRSAAGRGWKPNNEGAPGTGNAPRRGRRYYKAIRRAARLKAARDAAPVKVEILEVGEEGMQTKDLAYNLAINEAEIFSFLFKKGVRIDKAQNLDKEIVKMICQKYEVEVLEVEPTKVETMAKKKEMLDEEDLDLLEDRPPVITIMGHVDHGKTTLLDYIRKSRVVASEAGGITQGIGAYKVQVPVDGELQPCVFLDTPGHEAFGAMRARGARVTDVVIIVVAADDGVRPQTHEAIAHAKAAGVPIVVAINKIDKDGASPERVMQELSSCGLIAEDWGGDVPMIQISALRGENVDDLLETLMLVAELQELKANPHRSAKGTAIEACLDKAKGAVATLIVQNGTLRKGDMVVCGEAHGKIRALFDDRGNRVDEAGPSTAVQVIGLDNVPIAGDEFEVVDSLEIARERAHARAEVLRVERLSEKTGQGKVSLSSIAYAVSAGKHSGLDMHQLNIILKVDVQGSIEAIKQAIQVLPQENVSLKYLLQAPGDVTTSDIDLAIASDAIVCGFNVKAPGSVKSYAEKKNVEIRLYRVIYDLIDELRNAMEGLLEPIEEKIPIGSADVRATFSSGSGRVAGCMITSGKVLKDCGVQVIRNRKIIHTGKLDSLRRVKEDVKEVGTGLECGIGIDNYDNWEVGDVIEAFTTAQKKRTLEEASATVTAALKGAGIKV